MTVIKIPEQLIHQISLHGEMTYPDECCGVLLGIQQDGSQIVREILATENSQDASRHRRFYITPEQYQNAEHLAADKLLELLGFYHSHPDHPAIPSAFDTEQALPWFTYLIFSVVKCRMEGISVLVLIETLG